MKNLKWTMSCLALASLVAACGTTSAGQRGGTQRYEQAARDATPARKQQTSARGEEEGSAYDSPAVP